jgi:hypothetical protein
MSYLGGYIGGCFFQVMVQILWEMLLVLLSQVMMKSWNNCLWKCIGKGNVYLDMQLLWPTHLTCSMLVS